MEFALQNLSGGAHQRGALDAGVGATAFDRHLDVDAPLGMQHRDVTRTGRLTAPLITVPGSAKAVATPMAPVTACDAWQRRGVK